MYKIWSIERRSRIAFASAGGNNTTALRRAMHIVIESGLMYTLSVVIVFVVFLTSNNAQYSVSDCVSFPPLHLCEAPKIVLTRYVVF